MKIKMHISIGIFFLFLVPPSFAANGSVFFHAKKYWQTNDTSPVLLWIIGFLLVVILGVLVLLEIRKADHFNRRKMEVGWQKFYDIANKKKLSEKERSELESILRKSEVASAEIVFSSPLVFENTIEKYIEVLGSKISKDEFDKIYRVRKVLNYDHISVDIPYVSTRQLSSGTKVMVKSPYGNAQTTILYVTEENWVLANPVAVQAREKMPLKLGITRFSDGEYSIKTDVISVIDSKLVLKHSRNMSRKQLRNWVRVDTNIAAQIRIIKAKSDEITALGSVFGLISDISGGGVSLKVPAMLGIDDNLEIDFELNGHKFRQIPCHIIRVITNPEEKDDLYQHSLEFDEMESQVQERIIRFVFDKQRQDSQWR